MSTSGVPKLAIAFACFLTLCSAAAFAAETSDSEFILGTVCSVRLVDGGSRSILSAIFARLREIDARMSANSKDSEVEAINRAAGMEAVKVSPDTFFVVSKALEYARLSNGAFDPTIGPLVKLWGIGTESAHLPEPTEIAAALKLIDYRKVLMDPAASTVKLATPKMRLDLGAIAKGYAADEVKRILSERKVKAAVIDLGGNVYVFGKKKDGKPWKIGVQDPLSERGDYLGIVSGFEETVVTSGIYERFFEHNGRRYHHILDVKTGYPVDNGLVSTTIVASSSTDADGLSTTLFALGLSKGMILAKSQKNVEVIMVDSSMKVHLSSGAGALFTLTNKTYKLAE